MDDLISRKGLIEEFNLWYECLGGTMNQKNWIVQDTISSAIDTINEARGVEAEPVRHGEWVKCMTYDEDGYYDIEYKGSECGRYEPLKQPYCHCGAKMDGGKKE